MHQSGLDLLAAKQYIDSIDFSQLIDKLITEHRWRKSDALAICQQYRNYLFLCKKYRGQHKLPPSDDIDDFWHQHILDTNKYMHDCDIIFGDYYHHYPYFGIDGKTDNQMLNDAFFDTQQLYQQEFGISLRRIRMHFFSRLLLRILNGIENVFFKEKSVSDKKLSQQQYT